VCNDGEVRVHDDDDGSDLRVGIDVLPCDGDLMRLIPGGRLRCGAASTVNPEQGSVRRAWAASPRERVARVRRKNFSAGHGS
jgi:hypothetical protein